MSFEYDENYSGDEQKADEGGLALCFGSGAGNASIFQSVFGEGYGSGQAVEDLDGSGNVRGTGEGPGTGDGSGFGLEGIGGGTGDGAGCEDGCGYFPSEDE